MWVLLKEYSGRFEADLDLGLLEGLEIPVVVQGPPSGIFGPGFAGPTAVGVRVLVRQEDLDKARETVGIG